MKFVQNGRWIEFFLFNPLTIITAAQHVTAAMPHEFRSQSKCTAKLTNSCGVKCRVSSAQVCTGLSVGIRPHLACAVAKLRLTAHLCKREPQDVLLCGGAAVSGAKAQREALRALNLEYLQTCFAPCRHGHQRRGCQRYVLPSTYTRAQWRWISRPLVQHRHP